MQPLWLHCPWLAYLPLDPKMLSIEGDPNDGFDATIFQGFRNLLELERSCKSGLVNRVIRQAILLWPTRASLCRRARELDSLL